MGNNGWLLLRIIMLFLHCYCIIITHYYIVIMSWFLRIINHYCILLHIIAYCCFFQIHVTVILSWQDQGPAHQKLMETPDDDVFEPYPKTWSPPAETQRLLQVIDHVHKRQKPTAVLKSLDLGAVLAISANNTENSRINWRHSWPSWLCRQRCPTGTRMTRILGLNLESTSTELVWSVRLTVYPGLIMRFICFNLQLSTIFRRLLWMNCWRCSLLSKMARSFTCVPM